MISWLACPEWFGNIDFLDVNVTENGLLSKKFNLALKINGRIHGNWVFCRLNGAMCIPSTLLIISTEYLCIKSWFIIQILYLMGFAQKYLNLSGKVDSSYVQPREENS